MKKVKTTLVIIVAALAVSCASARVTRATSLLPGGLKVAVAPGGGAVADSIGIALFKRGYLVVDAAQMSGLLTRAGISQADLVNPKGLTFLRQRGFDAVLIVQAVMRSDSIPGSAEVSIRSTESGGEISGVSWQNGRAGARGSLADRSVRVGISEAAQQIVDTLVRGNQ